MPEKDINIKQSDSELMRRICNADKKAFDEIYNRYSRRLMYYFYRMLGNSREVAEDFLQDIFYKIIDKPHLYNPGQPFSTWLFSIANNMCKNEYRRRAVRKNTLSVDNVNSLQADNESVPENQGLAEVIYNELDNLGESHKTVFILRYREGFQLNEISEILNLPEGTIKSRLYYARQMLALRLKKRSELIEF